MPGHSQRFGRVEFEIVCDFDTCFLQKHLFSYKGNIVKKWILRGVLAIVILLVLGW